MRTISVFFWVVCFAVTLPAAASSVDVSALERGRYLATLGDCTSCHTAPHGKPYAGGLPIRAPFGTIYATNITPDPEAGIGAYSEKEFARALRRGIAKDGHHLYPAMPYPSYAALSDDDVAALYLYFMQGVVPVAEKAPATQLPFPFNQRWGIFFWNAAFARQRPYIMRPEQDAEWNRGAYLVQSIGHCGGCHTPRNLAYAEKGYNERSSRYLHGELADNWFAANLRGDPASGLATWQASDIEQFLATGHANGSVAFGNMTQVIENSTQALTVEDRHAVAHYLKSLKPGGEFAQSGTADPKRETMAETGLLELPAAGLYATACADCHGSKGEGKLPRYPALAHNPVVLSANATSLTRITLEGAKAPVTHSNPTPAVMPSFAHFTDAEIAQLVTYIRRQWGNRAATVSTREVTRLREQLKKSVPSGSSAAVGQPITPNHD